MKQQLLELSTAIDTAAKEATSVAQLSKSHDFDLQEAYQIQQLSVGRRLARGERLTGYKLGFTSKAKMAQMGVHEVIWGRLTDAMQVSNGGRLEFSRFIHPRAEPEIAFRVRKRIDRQLSPEEVLDHIDGIAAAIEIIDSRYENFKFSLEDVVADNCSSAAYVLGEWHGPRTAIRDLHITLLINGATRQAGSSSAILGDPLASMVEMSKMALKYGAPIEAGSILLAGAATPAEYLKPGDRVEAVVQQLGRVQLSVE